MLNVIDVRGNKFLIDDKYVVFGEVRRVQNENRNRLIHLYGKSDFAVEIDVYDLFDEDMESRAIKRIPAQGISEESWDIIVNKLEGGK